MRTMTHARWAACATALALATAGCGGGGGSGDSGAVLSASWGDPQNPLEPSNTNEVQGGKVLDMIFRGLKRYHPETGEAQDMLAEKIETTDSQNFTITVKDRWTFSNGEKVTAQSFVDAWNYGASLRNNQRNAYFFGYIEGYDQVHPEEGEQTADTLSGLKVTGERTFTVKLTQKFSTFPDTLGYNAFVPLPRAFFDDHDAWVKKPVGNGPYLVDSYTRGSQMSLRRWDDYPGDDKAQNGGVDLKVYTDANTAYTDLLAATSTSRTTSPPPSSRTSRPTSATATSTPPPASSRPSPSRSTTRTGTRRARRRSARACPWRSTGSRSPTRSSRGPAPPPPTGPHPSSARTAASRPACAGRPASTSPTRPRS